jgi:hypothetical protein
MSGVFRSSVLGAGLVFKLKPWSSFGVALGSAGCAQGWGLFRGGSLGEVLETGEHRLANQPRGHRFHG